MKIHTCTFLLLLLSPFSGRKELEFAPTARITSSPQKLNNEKPGLKNIIFKSTDGGQTWQDISEGLPENFKENGFYANDQGIYLLYGNGVYHRNINSQSPFWEKEILINKQPNIAPGDSSLFAYGNDGPFLQKINGTRVWSPLYSNFQGGAIHALLETKGGSVFICSDRGLYKSDKSGKSWKQVHTGGWVMKLAESNGVLLATSQGGILRSTDEGEHWDLVISEGGVGIAVECINGGFAAITYNTESKTRRVRISYDGGKTWSPIDAGLPPSLSIASIIQAGENFYCGHPDGIFRSSDQGKSWSLMLPSVENKVFNLTVSGKVIYAIPRDGGC
ncbi:MAG TPA: exo-alpha-sialidase [Saprospiraceae bacterium]|nr:exo-alpha-sialidase [Saprospiraceae bacterium]HNT19376.1 exo-alpha-sialidase [Saprospiraceae bacterium]